LGGISREFSSIPVTRRRYRQRAENRDARFAPKNGQKPWRGLRALALEFKRRGSDGYVWVFSDSPFDGAFGELEEYLERGLFTPDIITP
jgi:hypothetical protein